MPDAAAMPLVRPATEGDTEFVYQLIAHNDLRWPLPTRFHGSLHPQQTLAQVAANVEMAWVIADTDGTPVGAVGFVEADESARMVVLDAVAMPGERARALVAAAVPGLLDAAIAAEPIHRIHHEYYEQLGAPAIGEHLGLWEREVVIPEYARIGGVWCTRVTCTLDPQRWVAHRTTEAAGTTGVAAT